MPSIPLPRTVELFGSGLVAGRQREREVLDQALKAAESGDRRAVLLSGESGIGKTTLAAAFARTASVGGAAVAYGRCDLDVQAPYKPWVEVIEHLFQHLPGRWCGAPRRVRRPCRQARTRSAARTRLPDGVRDG
ncbi:MAG: ATP-binding protein [Microthrixaceae bacterium]|nr:ATP-binding protein [Microthrixaceae bacterium]